MQGTVPGFFRSSEIFIMILPFFRKNGEVEVFGKGVFYVLSGRLSKEVSLEKKLIYLPLQYHYD